MLNGPANAFLVREYLATRFETFKWWFEPTDRPHEYQVVSLLNMGQDINRIVTFSNHEAQPVDIPDPELKALHAAFAKVFRDSGAGE
ncbi:hypothetical protein CPB83DRAFT_851761 [Crepidotus variabilis]|uniref:Uncharacterized protein n=1 Tax=Crepidotus variabilis TaxID=179855 RepID=A0A9P6EIV5_9AGAR|nr:hypothetical protein CPB83DRAFT_851761 [Crepidotus variabilis]